MRLLRRTLLCTAAAACLGSQTAPPAAPKKAPAPKAASPAKKTAPAPAAMTNRDVVKMVQAKLSEDLVIAKIGQSRTQFDTSVDGMVTLKQAGVSDRIIAVMIGAKTGAAATPPPPPPQAPGAPVKAPPPPPVHPPDQTKPMPVAATSSTAAKPKSPPPVDVSIPPKNFGVYMESGGELKPLGRMQSKVQVSKFRALLRTMVPLVRQKVDVNIPGAHASARFETTRPNFYAYFPQSRDVSKMKLLQCKITGQNYDQRTLANASILFSTEQNQDEVPVDIGPTRVKDLYRISPREDLSTGEFAFVEGNTGTKSASNIEILDVYDFAVDRKEEKLPLAAYLDTLAAGSAPDTAFLTMSREDAKAIVIQREGKIGITGSLLGWFKRQYASLDVYWADAQFASAFARLEMLDRNLTEQQAVKLCSLLLSPDQSRYFVLVSIGGKVGSGKLIGANEGERLMRPFDASLSNEKSKDVTPARKLEFIGGYAGLWRVEFERNSLRGLLFNNASRTLVFEARLNQNLDLKARFPIELASPEGAAPPVSVAAGVK